MNELHNYFEIVKIRALTQKMLIEQAIFFQSPLRQIFKRKFPRLVSFYRYFKQRKLVQSNTPNTNRLSENSFILLKDPLYEYSWIITQQNSSAGNVIHTKTGNSKVIFIHAYYEDESETIFTLAKKHLDTDVIVTTSKKSIYDRLSKEASPNWVILYTPNLGRDILPFLLAISFIDCSAYTYFVKVHSKRSGHLGGDGAAWYYENIYSLLGDPYITNKLYTKVAPESLLLVGITVLSLTDHWENNHLWLEYLINNQNMDTRFIPGTMFLGTRKFLDLLKMQNLHLYQYEPEIGQLDGCLGHALERYFGYIIAYFGGEIFTLEALINRTEKD